MCVEGIQDEAATVQSAAPSVKSLGPTHGLTTFRGPE
jgi:hypothetical protein